MNRAFLLFSAWLASLGAAARSPNLIFNLYTIPSCSYWYDNADGHRSCEFERNVWSVSPEAMARWNPDLTVDCEGWTEGHSYCVAVKAERLASSRTTAAGTTVPAPSPLWTDLDCYSDELWPPLETQLPSPKGKDLTRAKCETSCWDAGYPYAGFKAGTECWCGYLVRGAEIAPRAECNARCAGNSSELCGGRGVFNMVEGRVPHTSTTTTAPTPTLRYSSETAPPLWTDHQCYKDASRHPFQTKLASPTGEELTRSNCEDACWRAGHQFVGFRAGVECWCGDYVAGDRSPSPADCNMPCAGNSSEMCGGDGVFNVVEGNDPPWTPTATLGSSSTSASTSSRVGSPARTTSAAATATSPSSSVSDHP